MRLRSLDRRLLAVCAVGAGLRLGWVLLGTGTDRFLFFDAPDYLTLSEQFPGYLAGGPNSTVEVMSLWRTPLYPAFQWLTSLGDPHRYLLIVIAQCLLGGVVNVALCHRVGRHLGGARVALVAATLLAVDPVSVSHSLYLGTETLAATTVLLAVLGLATLRDRAPGGPTWWIAVGTGVAAALAALVRPTQLYLIPVLAVLALGTLRRRPAEEGAAGRRPGAAWAVSGLLLVGALVPVVAWAARNHHVSTQWAFSTVQGENLMLYAEGALAAERGELRLRYEGDDPRAGFDPESEGLIHRIDQQVLEDMGPDKVDERRLPTGHESEYYVRVDRKFGQEGLRILRAHPRGTVVLGAYGSARILAAPGATANIDLLRPAFRTPVVRGVIWVWAIAWLVVAEGGALLGGVLLAARRRWWTAAVLVVPLAYCVLVSAGPFAYVRFRVPVSPLLCVLAAFAVTWLLERRGEPEAADAAAPEPDPVS